jgi:methylated-DNA-[protein]-cysteine S-methyltransferase
MNLTTITVPSPIGEVRVVADGDAVVALAFDDARSRTWLARWLDGWFPGITPRPHADPAGAATRLRRYFDGDASALEDQPVRMHGTDFQKLVWAALRDIGPGRTESYGALATRIGHAAGPRAVGAANGSNPVSLFVPCHRVIASDGTLHGYGGGLERKAWLLDHEGARFARSRSRAREWAAIAPQLAGIE